MKKNIITSMLTSSVALLMLMAMTISCNNTTNLSSDEHTEDSLPKVEVIGEVEQPGDDDICVISEPVVTFDKERCLSGVVLVRTMYYFKLSFEDELDFYFSGVDEDGDPVNLTLDANDIKPNVAYGTGFLVNRNGLIATNSHVISPKVKSNGIRSSLLQAMSLISDDLQEEVNNHNVVMGALAMKIADSDDTDEAYLYRANLQEQKCVRDEKQSIINAINRLHAMDYTITCEKCVGIVFNDTYITRPSDFYECVIKEEDTDNDLALIQLKRKGADVPDGSYIFEVPYSYSDNTSDSASGDLNLDTELTMIAFNYGLSLAVTDDGIIMAQMTSGKCTQIQAKKIMYNISSLPGSSGAPVIDSSGRLVAVNFAGVSTTQDFNYGIKVHLLRRLMDNG